MNFKHEDVWLGLGTIAFGILLLVYAIPELITAPSNVRVLVLSPVYWPTIVAYLIILLGGALVIRTGLIAPEKVDPEAAEATADATAEGSGWTLGACARLAASAILMAGLVAAIPDLGMVLSSCIAFALFSVVIASPRPVISLIVAIVLPFALYAFFAHVAGVPIPQGRFLDLP